MNPQLSQTDWLGLPIEVRLKLREAFGIKQSGPTQAILGTFGKSLSDGCNDKDVSLINVEAMQKYLGTEEKDFFTLFQAVLAKLQGPAVVPEVVVEAPQTNYEKWKEDLLRIRDESEAEDFVLKLKHLVWEIFPKPLPNNGFQSVSQQASGANKGAKKGK